jgi:hypothetical protein
MCGLMWFKNHVRFNPKEQDDKCTNMVELRLDIFYNFGTAWILGDI